MAVTLPLMGACSDDGAKKPKSTTTTTAKPVLSKDLSFERILSSDAQFAGFLKLAAAGKLFDRIDADGAEFTLLAPNSDAVAKLGDAAVAELAGGGDALTAVLDRHLLAGKVSYTDLVGKAGGNVETVGGDQLPVTFEGGVLKVGGATVVKSDIATKGGTIHVLDAVISG